MIRISVVITLLLSIPAFAQGTGGAFTTPSGETVPGYMLLIPAGPIENGQPVAAPPGPFNPLPVICPTCSPSAPIGASSNPVNGTIAATNTFQTLINQNPSRRGCTYQNQGTHTMYVSVAASPTLANSLQWAPGAFFYCSGPWNIVITDAIQITGTAGDAFAGQWQ